MAGYRSVSQRRSLGPPSKCQADEHVGWSWLSTHLQRHLRRLSHQLQNIHSSTLKWHLLESDPGLPLLRSPHSAPAMTIPAFTLPGSGPVSPPWSSHPSLYSQRQETARRHPPESESSRLLLPLDSAHASPTTGNTLPLPISYPSGLNSMARGLSTYQVPGTILSALHTLFH